MEEMPGGTPCSVGMMVWEAPEAHLIDARGMSVEHPKPCLTLHSLCPDAKAQRSPKVQGQVLFGDTLGRL